MMFGSEEGAGHKDKPPFTEKNHLRLSQGKVIHRKQLSES
jgi:hypothetical protein